MDTETTCKHLILGGARSGKSRYAEQLAQDSGKPVIYLATAKVLDAEIKSRVTRHQAERPAHWHTLEEPVQLAHALQQYSQPDNVILVDCLTMWMMNLLSANGESLREQQVAALLECLPLLPGQVLLVSNEVGMGVVPMGALSRQFVDESGRLHQRLAQQVERVTLMVAGLPVQVK